MGTIETLGKEHIGGQVQELEPLRHDSDNFARAGVDRNLPADNTFVSAETFPPVAISQDDRLWSFRRIIGPGKPSANQGRYSKSGQNLVRHLQRANLFGIADPCDIRR